MREDERLELIEGEIIQMAAIGTHHASCVKRLLRQFNIIPDDQAIIGVQDPIQLTERTEPQPDFVLLQHRADYYDNSASNAVSSFAVDRSFRYYS